MDDDSDLIEEEELMTEPTPAKGLPKAKLESPEQLKEEEKDVPMPEVESPSPVKTEEKPKTVSKKETLKDNLSEPSNAPSEGVRTRRNAYKGNAKKEPEPV